MTPKEYEICKDCPYYFGEIDECIIILELLGVMC